MSFAFCFFLFSSLHLLISFKVLKSSKSFCFSMKKHNKEPENRSHVFQHKNRSHWIQIIVLCSIRISFLDAVIYKFMYIMICLLLCMVSCKCAESYFCFWEAVGQVMNHNFGYKIQVGITDDELLYNDWNSVTIACNPIFMMYHYSTSPFYPRCILYNSCPWFLELMFTILGAWTLLCIWRPFL